MPKGVLLIDFEDSFTYNIWDYVSQTGARCQICSFSDKNLNQKIEVADKVILGPGPGNPTEMPTLQALIEKWYRQKPILGICLGFQAIAYFFGGKIDKGMPHHGKVERVKQMHPNQLFHQCPEEFNVVRYHSLLVSSLGKPLVPTLFAKNGELMAFEHESLPISGLQFHPEAHLSEFGLQIFANWLGV